MTHMPPSPDHSVSPPTTERRPTRVIRSCQLCRKMKKKCNNKKPCDRCVAKQVDCVDGSGEVHSWKKYLEEQEYMKNSALVNVWDQCDESQHESEGETHSTVPSETVGRMRSPTGEGLHLDSNMESQYYNPLANPQVHQLGAPQRPYVQANAPYNGLLSRPMHDPSNSHAPPRHNMLQSTTSASHATTNIIPNGNGRSWSVHDHAYPAPPMQQCTQSIQGQQLLHHPYFQQQHHSFSPRSYNVSQNFTPHYASVQQQYLQHSSQNSLPTLILNMSENFPTVVHSNVPGAQLFHSNHNKTGYCPIGWHALLNDAFLLTDVHRFISSQVSLGRRYVQINGRFYEERFVVDRGMWYCMYLERDTWRDILELFDSRGEPLILLHCTQADCSEIPTQVAREFVLRIVQEVQRVKLRLQLERQQLQMAYGFGQPVHQHQ